MATVLPKNHYSVTIGGTDITSHVPFPIKWNTLLDEQLDGGYFSAVRMSEEVFTPLTPVTIHLWDDKPLVNEITLNMLVSSDHSFEMPVGSGLFNHEIYLIEETKLLEGFFVRSHGYVNALVKSYTTMQVEPRIEGTTLNYIGTLTSPIKVGEAIHYGSPLNYFESLYTAAGWTVEPGAGVAHSNSLIPSGEATVCLLDSSYLLIKLGQEVVYSGADAYDDGFDMPGSAIVKYQIDTHTDAAGGAGGDAYTTNTFNIGVQTAQGAREDWNARSVIERALVICETLRDGCPRFTLDPVQAAEFEKIAVPEFQFTQSHLREILQEVGKFVHGEPRLRGHIISYDMLGSGIESAKKFSSYATRECEQSVDRYATNIDSNIGNLVNSLGYANGSFVEPYSGGSMSMRSETLYERVTDGNMCLQTKCGINSVDKLEWYDGTQYYDITPYVFESADYNQMSTINGAYPYSKSYALYYTQGGKNIQGFNYKAPDIISSALQNYAIVNILRAVTGNNSLTISDYPAMKFRIKYRAMISGRIQQSKSLITDIARPFTSAYNQGQNIVESHYYGENMKGVIARLGNADKTYTMITRGIPQLPQIGTLYEDDYYVAAVAIEVQPSVVKVTVSLSKDFNRYSAYVALDRQKRQYEISEKVAYDSFVTYRDYCVIGDRPQCYDDGMTDISDVVGFINNISSDAVSVVLAQGKDKNGTDLQKVALSVQPVAMGNAAVFLSSYKDNYSAGDSAEKETSGNVTGYYQNGVNYTDYFGDVEKLKLDYFTSAEPTTGATVQEVAQEYPKADHIQGIGRKITTGNYPLWVKKGNTEALSLNYQIDFVTNKRSIIVGSGLAEYTSLVHGADNDNIELYLLRQPLNKFTRKPTLYQGDKYEYTGDLLTVASGFAQFNPLAYPSQTYPNVVAWALVKNGELILGENRVLNPGDDIFNGLYICIAHDYLPKYYSVTETTQTVTAYESATEPGRYTIGIIKINGADINNWVCTDSFTPKQLENGDWYLVGFANQAGNYTVNIRIYSWED